MIEHLYRAAIHGLAVYWTAICETRSGVPIILYAATSDQLVRCLRGDAWCACVTRVLAVREIHQGEEAGRAVA